MSPLPARRMYASPPASTDWPPMGVCAVRPFARTSRMRAARGHDAPLAQRAAHRVAHDDVLLTRRLLQGGLRARRLDAPERDGGARADLRVLATSEHRFPVERVIEPQHAALAAQRAVRLEDRHLLGEIRVADRLALDDPFELRQRGPIGARLEHAQRGDADVAVGVVHRALERLQRAGRSDLVERLHRCEVQRRVAVREHLRRWARRRPASAASRRAGWPRAPRAASARG